MTTPTIDPIEAAEVIGIPLSEWRGNCYWIATAFVEAGLVPEGSTAVYGHWTGPIAERSYFADRRLLPDVPPQRCLQGDFPVRLPAAPL